MIARRTAVTNDLLGDDGYVQKVDTIGVTVQTRPLLSQARLSESFFIGGRLVGLGGSGVLYR